MGYFRLLGCFAAAAGLAAALLTGCESNSDVAYEDNGTNTATFAMVPASAHLGTNETRLVVTLEGGVRPFAWSVSDNTMGTFSQASTEDPVNTYRRGAAATANGVNVLHVQDARGWRATATVVQDQL